MRISTALMYRTGTETLNTQQGQFLHLYQQVGSGRRMVTPSDDPLAAARAINLGQTTAQNARFAANRDVAKQNLGIEDNVLKTVNSALQDVKTRLIEAGDGSYSDANRAALATVLRHTYELLGNQANARDGNGQYLFSGASGDQPAYIKDAAGKFVVNPDLVEGDRRIQVDQTRQLASADMAAAIFTDPATGRDLFATLDAVIGALETPTAGDASAAAALQTTLSDTMKTLDGLYDNLQTVVASVGARMQEIEALDNNGELRNLGYRKELSRLEDLNYYEATSQLTLRQTALEAAAMAFQRIQSTSLFNQ